tara:strand:- start:39 stop:536 length:498 start_codon:yes stop_codon:yes gene_type:complete
MNLNLYLKNIVSGLILIIGLILFLSAIINNNINSALTYLTCALIFWVIFGLLLDNFDVQVFFWIISSAGFLLAICIFFIYGVEEVAHPVGAIVFHSSGIAGALGIGFFSLFPILIMHQLNSKNKSKYTSSINSIPETPPEPKVEGDDWEIASEDELESGDFIELK